MGGIKHTILVLSGKGGVGKSTLSVQIAMGLKNSGKRVGILDVDLCGPSIPTMLQLENQTVHQCDEGWLPVYTSQDKDLSVMSIAFLLNHKDDPIIWRGPKKNAMIKQFIDDVYWGDLDYLVVDTPPGTSDEHLTVVECMKDKAAGAVLVSTPQSVAVADVQREITFCRKTGVKILGMVENMSGYSCPHCNECVLVFSEEGAENLAKLNEIPFWGKIPLDPTINNACEGVTSSESKEALCKVVTNLINSTK